MELELVWKERGRLFLDERRVALLESIRKHGSLTKAAKECNISYKAAWDNLQALSELAGCKLVSTKTGGNGGGGSALTKEAEELVDRYRSFKAKLFHERMQTEELNKLPVTIERIKKKSEEGIVWGRFARYSLKARLPLESLEKLGLREGESAIFMFKSYGCKGDENCMEGVLLESGKRGVKVMVADEVVRVSKYRLKGSLVHFCVDPKSIVVAKASL